MVDRERRRPGRIRANAASGTIVFGEVLTAAPVDADAAPRPVEPSALAAWLRAVSEATCEAAVAALVAPFCGAAETVPAIALVFLLPLTEPPVLLT